MRSRVFSTGVGPSSSRPEVERLDSPLGAGYPGRFGLGFWTAPTSKHHDHTRKFAVSFLF